MSRRYGRNQKRRHRAEVAELQNQAQKLWKIIDNQHKEYAELKHLVSEYEHRVGDVLGNRSWLKSCTSVQLEQRTSRELDSVLVQMGIRLRDYHTSAPHVRPRARVPIDKAIDFIELIAVKGRLVVEQLQKLMHVHLHFKEGMVAYTISPEQVMQLLGSVHGRQEFAKKLSEVIATDMVKHLGSMPDSVLREFARPTYKHEYIHW